MPHLVHSANRVPGKTLEPDSGMNGKALEARTGPKTAKQIRLPFFYGWLLVGVSFVTMAIGVNARTAYSLLFPQILDEFGWDRGVTAGAFSFGFLVSAVVTPCVGWLTDRRGPRLVIETGVVLMGTGLLLATLIREPWQLYRKRSVSGPAQAAARVASNGCQFQGRSSAIRRAGRSAMRASRSAR